MLHQVGVGSLGPVFRAHDPHDGRLVAVKAFSLELPPDRALAFVRALQELPLRGLDHPAIAVPVAAGLEGRLPWLAQAFVAAESLDAAVAEYGPPPLADVLAMVTHLAGALDFAAAGGVLHGALHPTDVLVAPDETYLVDLGVAGALVACGLRPPARAPYSAPEVLAGAPPSRAADVFALAAIAYELIAGEPLRGSGDEAASRLPDLPGADRDTLVEAFSFALALPTDERFPTALGFAAALKRGLGDAPAERAARRRAPALPAPVAAEVPPPESSPQPASRVGAPVSPSDRDPADDPAPAPGGLDEGAELRYDPIIVRGDADTDSPVEGAVTRFTDLSDDDDVVGRPAFAPDDDRASPEVDLDFGRDGGEEPGWQLPAAVPVPPAEPPLGPRHAPPHLAEDRPRGAAAGRRGVVAAILVGALVIGLAGGYFWGRSVAPPVRSAATDGPPAVVADAPAAAELDPGTEIELPPEVVPEPRDPGTPAELAPPVEDQAVEDVPATTPAAPPPAPASQARARARPEPQAPRPAAPPSDGRIVIRSTPGGARVEINGSARGVTPLTLGSLPLGAYDIRVTRQGYAPEQRRVTLTRGRPSHTITVPMRRVGGTGTSGQEAAASATEASLLVDSRPRGATVFLDGRPVGTTPLQVPEVRVGTHVVRLELAGHRGISTTVQVVAGERSRVAVSLEEEIR